MAKTYKVLGQSAPSATTDTTVYTVPASTQVVVSSVVVANRGSSAASFRVAVRPDGASLSNEHYIAYDTTIGANDVVSFVVGLTLNASDVISVYAGTANLSFSVFGTEIA